MVVLGKLGKSFGLKGWQLFHPYLEEPLKLAEYSSIMMSPPQAQQWQAIELDDIKSQGHKYVIHIQGVDNPEQAAELCHYEIAVPRAELPQPPADSYYWHDLIGARVINLANGQEVPLGTITGLQSAGGKDVMTIKMANDKTCYIPFVLPDFVREVDLEQGVVRVSWEVDF